MTVAKIKLRPMDPEKDSILFKSWIEDANTTKYMVYGQRPQTAKTIKDWLFNDISVGNDIFIIMYGNIEIGICGIYSISLTSRSAELRIMIGDTSRRGIGLGTESVSTLLFYAFDRLNLNSVWLGVNADNAAAIKCYQKCGFVTNGGRRQSLYRNGKYYDIVFMDILRSEYEEKFYAEHKKKYGI